MLRAIPRSVFSWGFDIYLGDELIVPVDTSWWLERGSFQYGGRHYQLCKAAPLSTRFSLLQDGNTIAEATKTALLRVFEVRCHGRSYTLRAVSPMTRRFLLEHAGNIAGEIAPNHPFTRRTAIRLPEDIPIEVRIFIFWLVALMWRRTRNTASAS